MGLRDSSRGKGRDWATGIAYGVLTLCMMALVALAAYDSYIAHSLRP